MPVWEPNTEIVRVANEEQTEVPGIIDIESEPARVQEAYGVGKEPTDEFGRRCLLARKLVEKGVRFVQVYNSSWDSHDNIERAHGSRILAVDQPIATLIRDFHVTLLRMLGLDDNRLTYYHAGRFKQLSQFGGGVIPDLMG